MIGAICLGEGTLFAMPFVVGSITEIYGISAGQAGLVLSLQMIAMGIVSLGLALVLPRVTLRNAGLIAGGICLVAHLVAAAMPAWPLFLASRVLLGVGEGMALAIANAAAARSDHPHRAFAIITIAMSVMGVALFGLLPLIGGALGHHAVFVLLLALGVITLPALCLLPPERCVARVAGAAATSAAMRVPRQLVAALAFVLFYISINGLWSYTERIATTAGLDMAVISHAYLMASIAGLAGPYLARVSEARWGLLLPLLPGTIVQLTGNLVIGHAASATAFSAGAILIMVGYLFLLPFFKSTMALLDPSGRLAAAAAGLQAAGTALGPGGAGLMMSAGGSYLHVVYGSAAALMIASILIAFCVAGRSVATPAFAPIQPHGGIS